MTDDFDDLEVTPDDEDENYVRIKRDDLKQIRSAARKRGEVEKELASYRRRDLIRDAGLDGLNDKQVDALAKLAEAETPEAFKQMATDLGWHTPTEAAEQTQVEQEIAEQEQAAAVTSGAPPVNTQGQHTPEQVNDWPADRLMRLQNQHPLVYDAVLRGEPITVPAGFN